MEKSRWGLEEMMIYVRLLGRGSEKISKHLFSMIYSMPLPFLAIFISPVFPPGPHSLLGGHSASFQPLARSVSQTVVFGTVDKRSSRYAPCPEMTYNSNKN